MSKHWKDVKAAIEKDIDRIWFEEPEEVKMSRLGIFPSGAGSHDQVLGNLFFQACDTQANLGNFGIFFYLTTGRILCKRFGCPCA